MRRLSRHGCALFTLVSLTLSACAPPEEAAEWNARSQALEGDCGALREALVGAQARRFTVQQLARDLDAQVRLLEGALEQARARLAEAEAEANRFSGPVPEHDFAASGGLRVTECDLRLQREEAARIRAAWAAGELSGVDANRQLSGLWGKTYEECRERFDPRTRALRLRAAESDVEAARAEVQRLERELAELRRERAALDADAAALDAEIAELRAKLAECSEPGAVIILDPSALRVIEVEPPPPSRDAGVFVASPAGPPVEGCDEEDAERLRAAYAAACAQDLHGEMADALTAFSLNVWDAICGGEVTVTLVCVDCDEKSKSQCAWGAPDLPLPDSRDGRLSSDVYAEAIEAAGGLRVHVCTSDDGHVPPVSRPGAKADCGTLRAIVLHELFHYLINSASHASSAWTDLAESVFRGEHGNR